MKTDNALEEINSQSSVFTEKVKVTNAADEAKAWQANADNVIEDALLRPHRKILAVDMQPFTSARGSLLRRANNEFIAGVKFSDIADPFLSIGKFLLLMSVSLQEGRRLVSNHDALEEAAYELLDTISLNDIETVVSEINSYVEREMSVQVAGELNEDMKKGEDRAPKN